MRVLVGIPHPKQVHFWKNIINNLKISGHEVKIAAWDKDLTLYLLEKYGLNYEIIGENKKGMVGKAFGMIKSDLRLLEIARHFKPDILVDPSPSMAHVGKIIGTPHIGLSDTEHANLAHVLMFPFSDVILTPSCYKKKINPRKHVRYNGYMELAYLHPEYFKPDPTVLAGSGLKTEDKFIILRFVAWGATHDIGDKGFTNKLELIKSLEQFGRVLITSERKLPEAFEKYRITVPPEKIHHLLYFADLYIGESAPMATESAILGTPSIFVSSSRRGYTDELEEKYGLITTYSVENRQELALKKAVEILENKNSKKEWRKKRERMLKEKIDVTEFMADFIERYPQSFYEYLQDES